MVMAVGINFDLNLAALFSPVLLVVLAYLVAKARDSILIANTERHQENIERLDRIETQTKETNGKVAEHDRQLTIVVAKQEVLMDLMLQRQPDKGA